MADDNYALSTGARLNEIGFADFTADLISKTFDALIDANLRQTESYIELVKEMTKSLSTYINDTKLEISNQEVLGFLGSMPTFIDDQGDPIANQAAAKPTPLALVPGETVQAADLTALNKPFTVGQLASEVLQTAGGSNVGNVASLVKDALGLVGKIVPTASKPTIFPLTQNDAYYDPVAFKTYLDGLATPPAPVALDVPALGKLYDSLAEVIAGDKYALLQEMVKLGVIRTVVTGGRLWSSLMFSCYERASKNSSTYDKHSEHVKEKYKQKQAPSRGILRLLRNRPLEKTKNLERDVRVQITSEQSSSSQGTTITISGGVEIQFKTDYLPLAQA